MVWVWQEREGVVAGKGERQRCWDSGAKGKQDLEGSQVGTQETKKVGVSGTGGKGGGGAWGKKS